MFAVNRNERERDKDESSCFHHRHHPREHQGLMYFQCKSDDDGDDHHEFGDDSQRERRIEAAYHVFIYYVWYVLS
jgi:hypothetical protein